MPISITPTATDTTSLPEVPPPVPVTIDRQALAEKVFALLKRELRIERERRGHTPPPSVR